MLSYSSFTTVLLNDFVRPSVQPQAGVKNLLAIAMERAGWGKRTVRMVAVETPVFHPHAMFARAGKRRCLFAQTQARPAAPRHWPKRRWKRRRFSHIVPVSNTF